VSFGAFSEEEHWFRVEPCADYIFSAAAFWVIWVGGGGAPTSWDRRRRREQNSGGGGVQRRNFFFRVELYIVTKNCFNEQY
jgi:hypothetical protein